MTLPNRVGYRVEKRVVLPPSPTSSSDLLKHLPPYNNSSMPADPQLASLFPFLAQTDVMKMVEKGLGYGMDPTTSHNVSGGVEMALPIPPRMPDLSFQAKTELSPHEENKKNFVRNHRLFTPTLELLTNCKKEGIIPLIDLNILGDHPHPGSVDFGLDDFLNVQEIDTSPNLVFEDPHKQDERNEFLNRLEAYKEKYKEELEKLNRVCNEFCSRIMVMLREQAALRPVTEQEMSLKITGIQQKFDYVRTQLRQNVCNAVLVLQKQYHQSPKKRRSLPKKPPRREESAKSQDATETLQNWFFDHLNDPYPADEEKSILAATGGLTMSQVNNWFGNKRIRYKRKCLEEETKRGRMSLSGDGKILETPSPPPMRIKRGKKGDE